ncbi:predicted protein [Histoplasma capsulatum G186AR]|uniref:Uncharacterized protein n=2 Tax=Ajellomyces capsulatus TaxID=5037 RepID=C0NJ55_AJECG|nr:uncharacterized protein HCBG_03185 [Histoplasma capsulatum G186AR]EEH07896.1 predicted protein [Histoplasma capsulatum G186AR]KAG5299770.1 hypothetical protein I7I52_10191 [Histoplasma capsulatum]QSS67603.1 hypothetical protein I7I50_06735 [Histoplasma capsulatum G186AR]
MGLSKDPREARAKTFRPRDDLELKPGGQNQVFPSAVPHWATGGKVLLYQPA